MFTNSLPISVKSKAISVAVASLFSMTALTSTFIYSVAPMNAAAAETKQADNAKKQYDIPAGTLESALTSFGRHAGILLSYPTSTTNNLNSQGLKGDYTVQEGLAVLLQGTALQAVKQLDGSYSLKPLDNIEHASNKGASVLPELKVVSNQLGAITEDTGSYTPGTIATATRLVLKPIETPQSITVVTRAHIDDFNLNSIDDVMRHTPGITVSHYDTERTNYWARGFAVENFQYDGIPSLRNAAYSAGQTLSDMAIYDRVEVLKGATGLLTGAGSIGATINLVRKKPTAEFRGEFTVGAGSWDNYRTQLDVSGPLTESGNVRGRTVMTYQDRQSFMDHYERKTGVFYGILEFDLSPNTLLTVGADYQNNDPRGSGWSGSFPLFNRTGGSNSFPRSYNNGAKWSRWEQETRTVFSTLEHRFDNGWVGKLQFNHQTNAYDAPLGSIQGDFPYPDGTAAIWANKYTGQTKSNSLDAYASGPFDLFGRTHELVVGASASRSHWTGKDYWNPAYINNLVPDIYAWNGNITEPNWGPVSSRKDEVVKQTGAYVTGRFNVSDALSLLVGTRVASYHLANPDEESRESGRVVPYLGAVYKLNQNYALYASYTDIFMPQTYYRSRDNKLLEPNEGQNYEAGLKGEFFNGALNTSLAYFEVHQDNRPESDRAYNSNPTNPAITDAYTSLKAKTKGYEAEISGQLAPGWQLQAGFTHKVIRDDNGNKVSTWEPENQFTLFSSYKFAGNLDKLTIGGGGRWQSKGWQILTNRRAARTEEFSQSAYGVVDIMARYQLSKQLSANLNINNVFDKKYYTNIGFYNSGYYGEPRNAMLTFKYAF
ncbi:TonB-dependent siderophore receptor [Methylobacillus gramineus]|uniref:TonB-dependent siderophore receptor n=1 Tax=Methylobacillus gramineus TaxID=755169 RepID=UPI00299D4442|nr:TonB-dependent siderophore receptor [Methylobacillus gramineus]